MRSFVSRTLVLVLVLVLLVRLGALSCSLPLRRRSLRARHVPRSWRRSIPPVPRPWRLRAVAVRGGANGGGCGGSSPDNTASAFSSVTQMALAYFLMNTALVKSPNVPFSAAFLSCSSELGGLRASAWSSASRAT